jgi:rfaE bifunctional protein kinase chain/domain
VATEPLRAGQAKEILGAFPKLSVLVVGDICLDRWCTYEPGFSEPSRETGIPRVGVVRVETTAGAAATVCNNLVDLGGASVAVLGLIGDDGYGFELRRALGRRSISSELVVKQNSLPTFTYTKLINARTGQEDLPRVDFVPAEPPPPELEAALLERLSAFAGHFDVILVQDQAETTVGGVVTPEMRRLLSRLAKQFPNKLFWVDSRRNALEFRGLTLKLNEQEADEACAQLGAPGDYAALRQATHAPTLFVTHGGKGVSIVDRAGLRRVPERYIPNPVDICGAGDAFSAGAAIALAVTGSPETAAGFGSLTASITIMKRGTGTATAAEVLAALESGQ